MPGGHFKSNSQAAAEGDASATGAVTGRGSGVSGPKSLRRPVENTFVPHRHRPSAPAPNHKELFGLKVVVAIKWRRRREENGRRMQGAAGGAASKAMW